MGAKTEGTKSTAVCSFESASLVAIGITHISSQHLLQEMREQEKEEREIGRE